MIGSKKEILSVSYGGQVLVETDTDKASAKALKKFLNNRKYFLEVSNYLDITTKVVDKNYISPKSLVVYQDKFSKDMLEVLITMEEFKYLKAAFVMYIDDMHNNIPKLEKLRMIVDVPDVHSIRSTINQIERIEQNPLKYLIGFILDDDLLHVPSIMEYIRLLNQYKLSYENVEKTLPEFAKSLIF